MVATARRSIGYSIAAALLAVASSVTAASSKIPNQKTPHPIVVKNAPDVNDSILIVGAGASGIHMAYTLANKGYKNITVMGMLFPSSISLLLCFLHVMLSTFFLLHKQSALTISVVRSFRVPRKVPRLTSSTSTVLTRVRSYFYLTCTSVRLL